MLLLTKDDGIESIAKNLFNYNNKEHDIPQYECFIQAFEKYSNLNRTEYKTQTVGTVIHFQTKEIIYEIDTYEGKTAELKSFISNRSYDEIYTETNEDVWSEIYLDGGFGDTFSKGDFLPLMLNEWEIYWNDKFHDIKEKTGKTDHLNSHKDDSWRRFQVFMECYNYDGDAIKLSYRIDDMILFPISVISMLKLFNPEVCYQEYCEHEFFGGMGDEWESITLNDDDSPTFFIREYEV